ncbi:MAG: hypothetical protein DRP79_04400 [Planctomycetota bacterium]|nr:MAG: hypothetical protein DRP79_04400 [Planctomycetota bacterium]
MTARATQSPAGGLLYGDSAREAVAEFARCTCDPVYFVNNYCRILAPAGARTAAGVIPFRLYPYQKRILRRLGGMEGNFLIEKSRQMGLSWLLTALELWGALFRPGFTALNVSRKQEEVDDRTPKSIFGKLRFMYERLPGFLKPAEVDSAFMRFAVPGLDSFIRDESANDDAGRGGTFSLVLIDEAAHIDNAETMWLALRQTSPCIVLNSTPNGKGNLFARIRFDRASSFHVMRVHWREHPERDEAWYAAMTRDMTEEEIAQELEISYEKSTRDRVYGEFDYSVHVRDDVAYNEALPLYTAQDFGYRDPWAILWLQTDPMDNVYVIDEYINNGEIVDHYAKVLLDKEKRHKRASANYADPAGRQSSPLTGSSIIYEFRRRYGIHIQTRVCPVVDGITAVKRALREKRLFISSKCVHLIDCIENYRYAPAPSHAPNRGREEPLHDWASHAMDALRYFFVNRYPLRRVEWEIR